MIPQIYRYIFLSLSSLLPEHLEMKMKMMHNQAEKPSSDLTLSTLGREFHKC